MFPRAIEQLILETIKRYKALTLIGPRQSGKTSLTRYRLFPDYNYLSLENPDTRQRALTDPRGFLQTRDLPTPKGVWLPILARSRSFSLSLLF